MKLRYSAILCTAVVLLMAAAASAGVSRVEISPSALVTLNNSYSGNAMGGSVTADAFFNRTFALRATLGYTKQRYYPEGMDYSNANYGFWMSVAPYLEMNTGSFLRPYIAVLGTFTGGTGRYYTPSPIGMELKPYVRAQQAARATAFYSFGATLGSKLHVAGPVSVHAEISHYVYTSISDPKVIYAPELGPLGREYDFKRNPTYLSFGLTYSFRLGK